MTLSIAVPEGCTPGPWRTGRKVYRTIYGPPSPLHPDGLLIGVLDRPGDALLAATAPELYAALKRIVDDGFSVQAEEQAAAAIEAAGGGRL